jgi:hypothetical protein
MGATGSAARGGTSVEKVGRPYLADPLRETVRRNNVRGKTFTYDSENRLQSMNGGAVTL